MLLTAMSTFPRALGRVPRVDAALDLRQAVDQSRCWRSARACRSKHPLRRPPHLARGLELLQLALRGGRDPDRRRRRRVGDDGDDGRRARHRRIEILKEMRFPHSLGLLYSAFTAYCGFEVNEGEYKLMGMHPYGKPRYRRQDLARSSTSPRTAASLGTTCATSRTTTRAKIPRSRRSARSPGAARKSELDPADGARRAASPTSPGACRR